MNDPTVESRAKDLFLDAVELPASDRAAYVSEQARGDEPLLRRVHALLAVHDSQGDAIEPPAGELSTGAVIGPYRLAARLGEGGFGVVYLAEQREPVKRLVALKIIKLGMDTLRVIARFEHERATLALMDHPNIAKVLDAGATATGRPYFVMERVDGIPLTEYCASHRVQLEQRLAMFAAVCHAVQHAHTRGVIHRDLKPSNVLVSEVDGRPVPKVIDFGIAKAIEGELADQTQYTHEGQAIGTPAYMSPEQMRGVRDIDTRSDVYSLGVILYQLLCEALPFDPETLDLDRIRSAVLNDDPPPPSSKLRASRGTTTLTLIPRDLDWIVLRALAKDRERRYPSAAALADDVERVLAHAPVEAAPPSRWYRMKKFVRRHRVASSAAAVVLLTIVIAVSAVIAALVEARRQERLAQDVNRFLVDDILKSMLPSAEVSKSRDVTMREVLDAAGKRIEEATAPGGRFADDPLVEAAVRDAIGESYLAIGRIAEGEKHVRRALDLLERERGTDDESTREQMLIHAQALHDLGRTAESDALLERVIAGRERDYGKGDPRLGKPLELLAGSLAERADFARAEPMCRRALALVPDDDDPANQAIRIGIAQAMIRFGRLDEAIDVMTRALEVDRAQLGPYHPTTLSAACSVAATMIKVGKFDEAQRLLEETYALQLAHYGADQSDTLVSAYQLGMLHMRAGRLDEADSLLTQALESCRKVHGEREPRTIGMTGALARLRVRQNRLDEAEQLANEARAKAEETLPEGHMLRAQSLNDLATVLVEAKRAAEAEPLLRRALAISEKSMGAANPSTRLTRKNLATVLRLLGREDDALAVEATEPATQSP